MSKNAHDYFANKMDIVDGLYGSQIQQCKACGYCQRHRSYLTVKMLKQHNCLQKQCWHLVKNEEHIWWKQRKTIKQKRKLKKIKYINGGM